MASVVAEIPNRELADEAPLYDRPHVAPLRTLPEAPRCPKCPFRRRCPSFWPRPTSAPSAGSGSSTITRFAPTPSPVRSVPTPPFVRIKETGTSIAMSLDGNGRYCYLSPREGARLAVAECCRNLSTVGAQPVAATNCLNFGNPERPEIMAQLVEAIEGIAEACRFFETPITGGNVSLYNETLGEGIYPTPVLGIVGLLPTAAPVTIPFKNAGRSVILLGGLGACDETRFGGTEYAKEIAGQLWGLPPALDMEREKRVQAAIREIVAEGLAESAHDLERRRPGGGAGGVLLRSGGRRRAGGPGQRFASGDAALPRRPVAHSGFHRERARVATDRRKARRGSAGDRPYNGKGSGDSPAHANARRLGHREHSNPRYEQSLEASLG